MSHIPHHQRLRVEVSFRSTSWVSALLSHILPLTLVVCDKCVFKYWCGFAIRNNFAISGTSNKSQNNYTLLPVSSPLHSAQPVITNRKKMAFKVETWKIYIMFTNTIGQHMIWLSSYHLPKSTLVSMHCMGWSVVCLVVVAPLS